jgi:phosphohistidine swiveling domain-containing protein
MKLESIPMSADPTFAFAMLQNYLRHPRTREQGRERAARLREEAERTVRERLAGPKLFAYRWVLAGVRRAVANRENQRFARTQAYALVRRIFESLGRRLAAARALDAPRDVYYLEIDEVLAWAGGTATCTNLTALVSLRKEEYARHAMRTPPDRREACGPVALASAESEPLPDAPGARSWRGTGACRGTVTGRARVVLTPDPALRLAGEILVARETDPGWTVLFPSIAGLVVEKGSMLSHSAIVAREMGIPAVVGVRGATRCIADGDLIRLDGATGLVELLT